MLTPPDLIHPLFAPPRVALPRPEHGRWTWHRTSATSGPSGFSSNTFICPKLIPRTRDDSAISGGQVRSLRRRKGTQLASRVAHAPVTDAASCS